MNYSNINNSKNEILNKKKIDFKNITEAGTIFFSKENKKRIQKMIKKEVYERTNKKFKLEAEQDDRDLTYMMEIVYSEHALNKDEQVIRQVKLLNKKLIEFIIKDIICSIEQNYSYILEINSPIKPMMRPMNVNKTGRKILPSITTKF